MTPISGRYSISTFALISSSLASSLIRICSAIQPLFFSLSTRAAAFPYSDFSRLQQTSTSAFRSPPPTRRPLLRATSSSPLRASLRLRFGCSRSGHRHIFPSTAAISSVAASVASSTIASASPASFSFFRNEPSPSATAAPSAPQSPALPALRNRRPPTGEFSRPSFRRCQEFRPAARASYPRVFRWK